MDNAIGLFMRAMGHSMNLLAAACQALLPISEFMIESEVGRNGGCV